MPKIDAVSPSMIASGSVGRGAAARGRPHSRGARRAPGPRILVARDNAGTTAIEFRTARLTKKCSYRVYTCYFYPVPRERAPAGSKRPVDSSSSPDEFCKTHGPRSFDLELGGPPSCGRHARCPLRDRGTAALITEQSRPPGTAFTAHEICPLDGTYFTIWLSPPTILPTFSQSGIVLLPSDTALVDTSVERNIGGCGHRIHTPQAQRAYAPPLKRLNAPGFEPDYSTVPGQ